MATALGQKSKRSAYLLLLCQTLVAVLIAFVVWLGSEQSAAISVLKGGLVVLITNFLFVRLAFRFTGARNAEKIYSAFMLGQVLKIMLTAGLCAFVLQQPQTQAGWFFLGFVLTLLAQWSAPVFFKLKT
ncbi:ATP synthase protein [Saliniradius amylolyticus]|uniref:ATP synthase protein n=1 Tax=Saliniradius amylolyticus TaxID=2183582 RepID=A0A2S2E7D1_9ALTE|nr:ATP synthase subunit I [Saliniradius amylolyticus]AWL13442.1 ATP synthase protein [Saliniradius amylolyticus]